MAPALFTLKGGDTLGAKSALVLSPRAKDSRGTAPAPALIVPSARPATSSRWQPAVAGIEEHALGVKKPPSSFDGAFTKDPIMGLKVKFNEPGRPAVAVRNFQSRDLTSLQTTKLALTAKVGFCEGSIMRATGGPNGGLDQVPTSSQTYSTGRISARPQSLKADQHQSSQIILPGISKDARQTGFPGASMLSSLKGLVESLEQQVIPRYLGCKMYI